MGKERRNIWLTPEAYELVTAYHQLDGCSTRSTFIERAIRFYAGYVASNKSTDYFATSVSNSVERSIGSFENRMSRILFKYAVEQALLMNVIAAFYNVDKKQIDTIRGQCVEELKRTRGKFDFKDAIEWQKGDTSEQTDS